jgi:DNA/RNA endonuclease YhcR with UshA esterase domain
MTGSRNFLLALAAAIIAPFALILSLPGNASLPSGAMAVAPSFSTAAATVTPTAISAEEAGAHDGSIATVEGVARQVHVARNGSATFIDFDGVYPNQPFSAVIFEDDMPNVGDVSDLQGKTVDVTGKIRMYRGHSEIIVSSRSQLAAR